MDLWNIEIVYRYTVNQVKTDSINHDISATITVKECFTYYQQILQYTNSRHAQNIRNNLY